MEFCPKRHALNFQNPAGEAFDDPGLGETMLTNTTEIGTATLPRRRLTIPAPTDVSPSAPRRPPRFPALAQFASAARRVPRAPIPVAVALAVLAVLATVAPEPAAAQTVTTFISNTGQTEIRASDLVRATAFTTGTGTYTLSSVGIFITIQSVSPTPAVKIYGDSGGFPGTLLATMTNPGTLQESAVNSFTAPANTTLSASTTYWVVTSNSDATDGQGFWVALNHNRTLDSGAAAGWSIGNSRSKADIAATSWRPSSSHTRFEIRGTNQPTVATAIPDQSATAGTAFSYVFPANTFSDADTGDTLSYTATKTDDTALPTWLAFDAGTRTFSGTPQAADAGTVSVKVTASDGNGGSVSDAFDITVIISVLSNWTLKPTAVAVGAKFRLLFLSSTRRNASSTDIATYNTFIQTTAAAGHTDIRAYSAGFRAVGCTAAVDARDNTKTTYTTTDKGVPIYWLNGAKAADQYEDFYDGSWDDEANDKNESGTNGLDTNDSYNWPLTGCSHDGTEQWPLGAPQVSVGRPNSSGSSHGPLFANGTLPKNFSNPMYGLSAVFQVANTPATGAPTITGTAQVGQTLTAGTTAIMDADGLTSVSYTYQWIRTATGVDTNISGATASTYTLVAADLGTTIKVRVSFTDDASNAETLTSAATAAVSAVVPADWTLKPTAVAAGTQFRLLFLSSTRRNASSTDIATYNTFIQTRAAAGHTDIRAYSAGFRVVGCTAAVDARDNTKTTYTTTDKGVPIYWLNGAKAADQYEDFYDGSWDDEANDKNESGTNGLDTSQSDNYPLTGCSHDGTEQWPLGASQVSVGRPNSSGSGHGPLFANAQVLAGFSHPMYGLSEVFQVAGAVVVPNNPPTVANAIPDQSATAGTAFSYAFPANTFSDADTGDTLSYTATKADGTALPTWLAFTASTRTFSGTPQAADAGTVAVKVTASDGNGGSVSDAFDITVAADTTPPTLTSATVIGGGKNIKLQFSENIPFFTLPPGSAFTVTADGVAVTTPFSPIWADSLTPDLLLLRVSPVILQGQAVVVTYTDPTAGDDANAIQDTAGNDTATFTTGMNGVPAVTNNSTVTNTPATGAPTITGTAQVGQMLTAGTTAIMDADGLTSVSYTYQWIRTATGVDTNISGATASTYTLVAADLGTTIKVRVSFTDDASNAETLTSATTAAVSAAANTPATGAPTITGTAQVGQMLTAGTTAIMDADGLTSVSYTYQWIRTATGVDTNISGATASTYTLVAADLGTTIKVRVSFTDDASNAETLTSATTAAVSAAANTPATGAPTITGTAQVGQTLTAGTTAIMDADGLTSVSYTYQWIRTATGVDTNISGATASTYTLVAADLGTTIKVRVSFTDDASNAETLTSATTAAVSAAANTPATGAPTITGTAQVGQTLTATKGTIADSNGLHTTWFSNAATTLQWIRVDGGSDSDISSATDRTYTLVAADEGKQVKVKVDFTDDDGHDESLTSDAYPAGSTVLPVDMSGTTGVVSFSGDPTVGTALTATLSDSDNGVSGTPTWQWARSARPDTGFTDISSATGASYTPVEMDRAFFLRATATYSDGGGSGKTAPGTTALPVGITSGVFIKNTRQTARPFDNNSPRTLYQGFRTGDNPAGYLLTLVLVGFGANSGDPIEVQMYRRGPGESGFGSLVYELQPPTDIQSAGDHIVDAPPGAVLEPETDHFLRVTNLHFYSGTTSRNADGGAASGWAISGRASVPGLAVNNTLRILVRGMDLLGPPGPPGSLSATGVAGSAVLTWTAPGSTGQRPVTKYQVRHKQASDPDTAFSAWSDVADSDGDGDLADELSVSVSRPAGTEYTLEVRAVNTNGAGTGAQANVAATDLVPSNWSLKPTGLSTGDKFRLLFLSSTKRNKLSANIATYNTFIQTRAAAGHADIRDYSAGFTAVGCTAAVDARDNTKTTYTTTDKGVPVYWLNGAKAADEYEDFYDGSWDDEANDKNESGTNGLDTSLNDNWPLTGCDHDGTEEFALGSSQVRVGRPNSSGSDHGPLSSDSLLGASLTRPLYGLSAVFEVAADTTPPTLTSAEVDGTGNSIDLQFSENVDRSNLPPATAFTVTVGGSAVTVSSVTSPSGAGQDSLLVTVSPVIVQGQAVVVAYADPTTADDANAIQDAAGNDAAAFTTGMNGVPAVTNASTVVPATTATEVPANWSLKPTAVTVGTQFRLLFLSSAKRNASSTAIADYNTFIQGLAAAGHADIQAYSTGFRVVGCTAAVDARDNTSTTYTSTDKGVPIYWLNGAKAADQYEDFYDGSWDDEANDKNESGTNGPDTSNTSNYPYTGCDHDGTEAVTGGDSFALGTNLVDARVGRPNFSLSNVGPLNGQTNRSNFENSPLYGLSEVFQVAAGVVVPNNPPAFSADTAARSVAENTAAGQNVGAALTATDADSDTLTYTLEGTDAASFDIVSGSGQIQTRTGVTYNHEAKSTHTVVVKADDGNGGTDTIAVTIAVTDVDEPPGQPAAPTVSATAGSTTSLDVTWTAPTNTGPAIASYDLQYRAGTSGNFTNGPQTVTGTSAAIGSLAADTSYEVQVRATNAEGDGDWSVAGTGRTTATSAPGAPTGLSATASGTTAINLSWTAPGSTGGSAITGYKIEVSPNGTSGWTDQVANTGNATTTYAHTGLAAGATRHYRVSAINANGAGTASNVDSATTDATVPDAPTGLTATASGATQIDLSWTAPASTGGSAITGYKIEVSPNGTSGWTDQVANTNSTATTYEHTGLAAGTTRHYRVSAINTNGTGDPSNVDSATTGTTVPGAPTGLTATASGSTAINLSWTAPGSTGGSAITGYKIEVSPNGTSGWTDQAADTNSTATTYAHTGLAAGDTRHYRVSAINANGAGTASNVDSATTDATVPGAPTGLTATASGATQIDLSWTAPGSTGGSAITGYKIEVSANGTSGWTDQAADTNSTATTYAHTGLGGGTTRHYRVSAINANGAGTASNVDSATTGTTVPGAPTGLAATASGSTQINLSWSAPASTGGAAITGYKIEVSPNGTSNWTDLVANTGNATTTYAHTGLAAGDTRHYRVSAINANGAGAPSDVANATTNNPPAFSADTADRSVAENTAAGQNVGAALTATDADSDTLTYTLEGADAASFDLVSGSGQIRTKTGVTYNHEAKSTHTVIVKADDGNGGADAIAVTITVTDVDEPPGIPAAPTVTATAGSNTSLDVSWTAPANTGPAITSYDLQYREGSSGNFTDGPQNVTVTSAAIGSLAPNTSYQVQVRATSAEGDSQWSLSGTGQTGNSAPAFSADAADRSVAENTAAGQNVGAALTATDADSDTLTYTLEGADAASFDLVSGSGQIRTKTGVTYNHEAKSTHTVIVKADDGNGGADAITVTITVTDVDEPPGIPAAPTVTATAGSNTSLDVTWTAPANTGPAITSYDLQYREGDSGNFTDGPQDVTGTSAAIGSLMASTSYQVQVRATSAEGDSQWSLSGTGQTNNSAGAIEVPANWSLKPTGRAAGDQFRLLFLSSTKRDGSSTDIATYNTFVQERAAAGHADIRTYSAGFRAVGCTSDVDARDNTRTTGTGVPIYWLNGAKAADNYADFYDGSWDDEVNDKNESGTNGPDTSQSVNRPFTGCEHNGTEALDGSISQGFGAAGGTKVGRPNSSSALHGPLSSNAVTGTANTRPMYGLSVVFRVAAAMVVPNNPPAFSADTATRSVAENTAAGQNVGGVLTATDADSDTLTYTLEGTDAASFDIVSASGQIRTRTGVTYNHEATSTYTVIVKADDSNGGTDTVTVTITVTDVDEPPGIPAAPTVTATAGSNTSLDVTWTAPANTGPAIASYDLQYRQGTSGNFTDGPQDVTGTSAAIGSLAPNTSYEVQVRATNAEGDSQWSLSGTGQTGNNPPAFSADTATRSVAENTAAGQNVGAALTATDADSDTLTYTLEGADAASFDLVSGSGQIRTKTGVTYNHEAKSTHAVVVKADDGNGGADTVTVTIAVTDVDEPPGIPAAPTVTATAGSNTSLDVSWTAPANTGPAITSYDLQYREGDSGNFTNGPQDVTGASAAIGSLIASTSYQVQVRATNAEGDGDWSLSGTGQTGNSAPAFSADAADRSVPENTAAGQNVGAALTATDADSDTLTYTLEGADAASFDIVSGSGQIRTKTGAIYNHEAKSTHTVIVKADDGNGGADAITVTITVTDVDEPPGIPAAPTVSATAGSNTSLDVSWTAPANTGPAIASYDLRYREGDSGNFTNGPQDVTGASAAIGSLMPSTSYQVQVRATNAEGDGDWSLSGTGQTGNNPPAFSADTADRSVAENTAAGQNVGGVLTATDADSDTLTYTLEGTDAASFDIVSGSGQIQTRTGVTYNHEATSTYTVVVKADDGNGGTDTVTVTITVTDVDEPPGIPAAPTVTATAGSTTSLDVTWTAPANTGPAIASYDLQYREGDSGNFTDDPQDVTGASAAIGSLMPSTSYQVQVRATNAEGDSQWSLSGTGQTGNSAPAFSADAADRSVAENTAAGQNVGAALTATDADSDTLTYTLEGADAASFDIVSGSGQIRTKTGVIYNHEATSTYTVIVKADDGNGGADAVTVTITVTDVDEPPGIPAAPTVSATAGSNTSLDVSWTAPANTGPAIASYDLQYREGDSGNFTDGPQDVTGASAAIGSLMPSTSYQVQVRATNAEGDGDWSLSGTGQTGNNPPAFSADTAARSVAENTAAGQNVGGVLTATDADSDTLTYTLEGTDAASFDIVSGSGQIRTRTGVTYNHEATSTYSVVVKADDGNGGADTVTVTITVTDVDEPPGIPAAPTVTATAGSNTSLDVSWTAPANTGPAIASYDLQYREGDSGNFTDGPQDVTGASAAIGSLMPSTSYQVQVRATNAEGDGDWSLSGTGQTGNSAPAFSADTAARSVAENTAAGQNVGGVLTATDADSDTLTYTLEGTDAASFDIVSGSGQIRTRTGVTYNHEAKSTYSVVVKADDGNGGADTVTVTITVTDVDEPPGRPAAPSVTSTAGSGTSLDVTWTAPSNTGPAIASYDLQYREGDSGNFTDGPQDVTGASAAIGSLMASTSYQVQVRATNAEGDGDWSLSGTGQTGNNPPAFSADTADRSVAENTAAGQNVGGVLTATDADSDTLTYTLEGTDAASFDIVSGSGQIRTKTGATYNHEAKSTHTVIVKADDGNGGADAITVTITVTDVDEPPGIPAAPTVTATAGSTTSLDVTWTAPANTGPAIASYDLQYREGDSGNFTNGPQNVTGASAAIGSLMASTSYQVQVRATSAEGDGDWSLSGTGQTGNSAPGAPTVLSATAGGTTRIDLSWTAPASDGGAAITGYKIEVSSNGGSSWTNLVANTSNTTTAYAHTGLAAGTTRHYRVSAINANGAGAPSSNVANATTGHTTVTFGAASYTAAEGGAAATVAVQMSAAPSASVTIPLTKAHRGGATAADYSGVPSNVTFTAGQTRRTFTVTATDDPDKDGGESVQLGFGTLPGGYAPGARRTATVTLVDDDANLIVNFGTERRTTVKVRESDTVWHRFIFMLTTRPDAPPNGNPQQPVTIPLAVTHRGGATTADYEVRGRRTLTSVTFGVGESVTDFFMRAIPDRKKETGEGLRLDFGPLPAGVRAGTWGPYETIEFLDEYLPDLTVRFGASSYTAAEGGADARVSIHLSEKVDVEPLVVRLSAQPGGGATPGDYSVPSSVTFAVGEQTKTIAVAATDDTDDDDGESVTLSFVNAPNDRLITDNRPSTATVALEDNDGAGKVEVSFGAATYTATEGGSGATVRVQLDAAPGRAVTVPLTKAHAGGATAADYSGIPANVTFGANQTSKTLTVTATDDTVPDGGESVRIAFGALPQGVLAGRPAATVVTLKDGTERELVVQFDTHWGYAVEAREGGVRLRLRLLLNKSATRPLTIPLAVTHRGGATAADYAELARSVTIPEGAKEAPYYVRALPDGEAETGEGLRIDFGPLPPGVTKGAWGPYETIDFVDADPTPSSLRVSGSLLTLGYPGALDGGSTPSGGDFVVLAGPPGGEAVVPVTSVSVEGESVLLRLARPVTAHDTVTLTYLTAAMHPIRDAAGAAAAPLADEPVRNETGASGFPAEPGRAAGTGIPTPLAAVLEAALADGGTERLDLSSRNLTDVSALAGLSGVRELNLRDNAIADLSPLAGLAGLQVLNLAGNRIEELWPLSGLTGLERLNLAGNRIEALSPLAGLSELQVLDLAGNRIEELWPLAGLTGLERLNLSGNRIEELWPLAGLGGLEVLLLDGNGVADVGALSPLAGLENLGLSGNRIADIGPLAQLGRLRRLDLSDNAVADISALGDVSGLLWPLAGLGGLEVLLLDGNGVADVGALSPLAGLENLGLSDNRIADIGPLAQLGRPRRLDLSGNAVADISALGDVSGLLWLRLPGNPVSDVTPLGRLENLRWLWLDAATAAGMEAWAPPAGPGAARLWIERVPAR